MCGIKLLHSIIIAILICSMPLSVARAGSPSQPAATISGQIVDETGGAIPGATVTLGSPSDRAGSLTSKADGTFAIEGVAPGNYVIKVEISGFDTYQHTLVVGQEPIAPLKITLRVRSLETDVTVEADEPADAFSTSASNGATMRMDDDFRRALPIVANDFLGVVGNFFYPAAQGSQGNSVIVDGVEGDQIEVPSAAIGTVRLNRNPVS